MHKHPVYYNYSCVFDYFFYTC